MERATVQEILEEATRISKDYPELSYNQCIDQAMLVLGQVDLIKEGRGQAWTDVNTVETR